MPTLAGDGPLVAVADTKYVQGISNLSETAQVLTVLPIEKAFTAGWRTDAHCVCYYPVGAVLETWPRLNKPILRKLRAAGSDIVTRLIGIDCDTPGHVPWTPELLADFHNRLRALTQAWPMAGQWACFYTTKKGARFFYILDREVKVDDAEGHIRWMVQQFDAHGFPVDKLCDWTRLFRLPFVVRDSVPTWEIRATDPVTMQFEQRWGARINVADLGIAAKGPVEAEYGEIRDFTDPRPIDQDALELVQKPTENGRKAETQWCKEAKRRLKGRECWPCLFDHAPLAAEGSRDNTLHTYVGQCVTMLFREMHTTPAHIYGLFLPVVEQLTPDEGTPDWGVSLWSHIGRCWAKESAKKDVEIEQQTVEAEQANDLLDRIIGGMREWCRHPSLIDDKTAREFVTRHLIVSIGGRYYLMGDKGWYDGLQLTQTEVIPRARILGMESVLETRAPRPDGLGWQDVSIHTILNRCSTVVSSVSAKPCIPGGYITGIDQDSPSLTVGAYRRNPDLEPTYDRGVDLWLEKLFGERYPEMCEWIAWALAFEEGPICAVSIKGDPGVGKKLLTVGLSECLQRPALASADDMLGAYQYRLMETPFLVIDEGWPEGKRNGRHPADQFRAIQSGQAIDCNRKFMAPVTVANPLRILFTSNNTSVVHMLTHGRELSPEDRDALSIRMKHIDVGGHAAEWLRLKGGMAFTGRDGCRWIAGDGGKASDFVVARHFLWLYSIRSKPVHSGSARFLVEGGMSQEMMFEMRTRSGSSPLVIEILIKLLNLTTNGMRREGIVIFEQNLYVLTSEVLGYYRDHIGTSREHLNASTILGVFKGLVEAEREGGGAFEIPTRKEVGRRRWCQIDPELLLDAARQIGWGCAPLEQLVAEREAAANARARAKATLAVAV